MVRRPVLEALRDFGPAGIFELVAREPTLLEVPLTAHEVSIVMRQATVDKAVTGAPGARYALTETGRREVASLPERVLATPTKEVVALFAATGATAVVWRQVEGHPAALPLIGVAVEFLLLIGVVRLAWLMLRRESRIADLWPRMRDTLPRMYRATHKRKCLFRTSMVTFPLAMVAAAAIHNTIADSALFLAAIGPAIFSVLNEKTARWICLPDSTGGRRLTKISRWLRAEELLERLRQGDAGVVTPAED
jgi:hypothetical protein